jgi:hypothetical protein
MEKHTYNQLATKLGHNHIHFIDKKGKVIKKVEAKA